MTPYPPDELLLALGVVTDPHYSHAPPWADRHYADSLPKLQAAVAHLDTLGLHALVNLGDLVDHELDHADDAKAVAAMARALAAWSGPRLHALGNHDLASFTKPAFLAMLPDAVTTPYYVRELNGVRLVVLDANCRADGSPFAEGNFSWDDAWLDPPQLDWLADTLRGDTPTVVICHGNLAPWISNDGVRDPHVAGNADRARAILEAAGNVLLVLHGHCHRGAVDVVAGIPYLTLQAMVTGPGLANNAYSAVYLSRLGHVTVRGYGRQSSFTFQRGQTHWQTLD